VRDWRMIEKNIFGSIYVHLSGKWKKIDLYRDIGYLPKVGYEIGKACA
jgi:hypothetical protein